MITPEMPDAITIPGAVAAWSLLHKEHGYMPWKDLFSPAINFATQGIKVHERVALDWSKNLQKLSLGENRWNQILKDMQTRKQVHAYRRSHGGEISLMKKNKKGTCFRITLPILKDESEN